jgi:hypothetical protein
MRVRLYRNLSPQYRQQHAWSIMAMEGPRKGKVVDIVDGAVLSEVVFLVSEAGRQRVLRDRVKNVHAFVEGQLVKKFALNSLAKDADGDNVLPGQGVTVRIGYDPYRTPQMVREDCMEDVDTAPLVVAAPRGVYAQLPPCRRGLRGLEGLHLFDIDDWNG